MPHAQAVEIIRLAKSQHFDPDLVDACLDIAAQFEAIAGRFIDTHADVLKKARAD
jgi:putative two-component system response regulator